VPDSRISPVSKRILGPAARADACQGTGINYEYNSMLTKDTDSFDVKVDHNMPRTRPLQRPL
jgi:hypothetical protein